MRAKPLPPLKLVQQYLKTDPTSPSGLRWIKRPSSVVDKGEIAGYLNKDSHRWMVKFKSKLYLAYRIVFYLTHKKDPGDFQIDHINGDSRDNSINNLRLATSQQNCSARTKTRKKNGRRPSKYRGVKWDAERKKWKAYITHKRERIELGRFETEVEAAIAYDKAAKELNQEFAVLNFPQDFS